MLFWSEGEEPGNGKSEHVTTHFFFFSFFASIISPGSGGSVEGANRKGLGGLVRCGTLTFNMDPIQHRGTYFEQVLFRRITCCLCVNPKDKGDSQVPETLNSPLQNQQDVNSLSISHLFTLCHQCRTTKKGISYTVRNEAHRLTS